jgi:hypothetical protein
MIIEHKELIVATCTPIAPDHHRRTPELLLDSARVQAAMAEARTEIADPVLVSGKSWSLLLQVYIAEGEGRAVSVEWLAGNLRLTISPTPDAGKGRHFSHLACGRTAFGQDDLSTCRAAYKGCAKRFTRQWLP